MRSASFRRPRRLLCALLASAAFGCVPAPELPVLSQMDAARESPAARDAARLAPQAYLHAERLRQEALAASDAKDTAAAQIRAEHAIAAYTHAAVVGRIARARQGLATASLGLERANARLSELDREQAGLEAAADQLELELKVHRDALPMTPNAPATPDREEARLKAAQALSLRARLLCVAARLLANEDPTPSLLSALDQLDKGLAAKPTATPIDDVMRLNTACLKVLSEVRRPAQKGDSASVADALLAELSERGGLFPFRDDRGVVVTLRNPGSQRLELHSSMRESLGTIGQVAKAHAEFPLLVVVHAGRGAPTAAHRELAENVAKILRSHGAAKVGLEVAGGLQPLVDWKLRGAAEQNTRLEVVFVTP